MESDNKDGPKPKCCRDINAKLFNINDELIELFSTGEWDMKNHKEKEEKEEATLKELLDEKQFLQELWDILDAAIGQSWGTASLKTFQASLLV